MRREHEWSIQTKLNQLSPVSCSNFDCWSSIWRLIILGWWVVNCSSNCVMVSIQICPWQFYTTLDYCHNSLASYLWVWFVFGIENSRVKRPPNEYSFFWNAIIFGFSRLYCGVELVLHQEVMEYEKTPNLRENMQIRSCGVPSVKFLRFFGWIIRKRRTLCKAWIWLIL